MKSQLSFHRLRPTGLGALLVALLAALFASASLRADPLGDFLRAGTVGGELRLRYEDVEQESALSDAQALTLRTRLNYSSPVLGKLSALLEMKDVRIVGGVDDYSLAATGFKAGEHATIADPETTELDQALLQYKGDEFVLRVGRQTILLNDHRFVGDVGWRQDRQTFDALSAVYNPTNFLKFSYTHIAQRNRIFAEAADISASDHLFDGSYTTPLGKLMGFAYLLEEDEASENELDSYGIGFEGASGDSSRSLRWLYALRWARQEARNPVGTFSADHWRAEGGVALAGASIKLGYEVLGSDDGRYGFSTPLATLHKFNGWADMFSQTPAQGLTDAYLSLGGKIGPAGWTLIYHDFEAEEDSGSVKDLGRELDLQLLWPLSGNLNLGAKYARYAAGDGGANLVDTDKFWLWSSISF